MRSGKDWNIHWNRGRVGFVETNSKVSFSAQQKQDEDSDVHQSHPALVSSGVVQMMQNRSQNVENIARFENEEEKLFVVLAKLPEEYEQLLMELNLSLGVRKICLDQRIHQ